ncbi:hypothetical protein GGX14DRAFT_525155 [Mycena pura]|uniref:CNNM transmembrane domain-containing protein n=1 Tax=Mycena pura TaxID=153505 RepID=A0AAD6Y6L4_9AGAR|nr:hypothetical protein GGX14DRAFT_525155 [Mycena pura]
MWLNDFWMKIGVSAFLVLVGGVSAGLTLALMGLDELHLMVLSVSSDDPAEQANATKVLALLQKGRHWVLVVLLISNVIVNESLPIFLDSAIGGGFAAVALSTTAIVIFGIIPQALSVRYGLSIGAACAPIVLGLMYLLAPIAYPIARLLDYLLGADGPHMYRKAQLKSFLELHRTGAEPLRDEELSILQGVLELGTKSVEQLMTPMKDVMTLAADAILDDRLMDDILQSGYSRFPVHEKDDPTAFIGLLLVKKLLGYDPARALPVSAFPLSILPETHQNISCFQALDYFQTGRAHLLLISGMPGTPGGAVGVLTLEGTLRTFPALPLPLVSTIWADIIEEILSEEIVDETDWYEDNVTKLPARRITTASIMRGIVEYRRSFALTTGDRAPLLPGARTPSLYSLGRNVYASNV